MCEFIITRGDRKGDQCNNNIFNNSDHCKRHYKDDTKEKKGSTNNQKDKSGTNVRDRSKEVKWDYNETIQLRDKLKASRKRTIINDLMTIQEDRPKPKKKQKKEVDIDDEDKGSQQDDFLSDEDSYVERSSSSNTMIKFAKMGLLALAERLFEPLVDNSTDIKISGTMKTLYSTEEGLEIVEEMLDEMIPDEVKEAGDDPFNRFFMMYAAIAYTQDAKNRAREQINNINVQTSQIPIKTEPIHAINTQQKDIKFDENKPLNINTRSAFESVKRDEEGNIDLKQYFIL